MDANNLRTMDLIRDKDLWLKCTLLRLNAALITDKYLGLKHMRL